MAVGHYENFPVASVLLPARLRHPVAVIYRFARTADDFADEGQRDPQERLALLDGYRTELRRLEAGDTPRDPLFADLRDVARAYGLPWAPFHDLLDAFSQDVVKARYASFDEVLDYCRRSADPVGRLMLYLYGVVRPDVLEPGAAEAAVARRPATPDAPFDAAVEQADAICSALQLINFWQDVAVDFAKDRIYLPQDDMARHGVTESDIANATVDDRWKSLMRFEIARARAMLESGAPLATRLRGRIGMELRMIVQGGRRILEKLDEAEGDVFRRRPVLGALDWPLMLIRALAM